MIVPRANCRPSSRSDSPRIRNSGRQPAYHDGALMFRDEEWARLRQELHLSPREMQVVRLIFADDKEEAIAGELGISPSTVHTYIERLYRKLGVRDRVQMVVRVTGQFLRRRHGVG